MSWKSQTRLSAGPYQPLGGGKEWNYKIRDMLLSVGSSVQHSPFCLPLIPHTPLSQALVYTLFSFASSGPFSLYAFLQNVIVFFIDSLKWVFIEYLLCVSIWGCISEQNHQGSLHSWNVYANRGWKTVMKKTKNKKVISMLEGGKCYGSNNPVKGNQEYWLEGVGQIAVLNFLSIRFWFIEIVLLHISFCLLFYFLLSTQFSSAL